VAERVLVTGATGFIGRQVLEPLLARGFEVHGVARHAGPGAVPIHAVDLLKPDEMRALVRDLRPALLLHTAWYVAHGKFWTAPENADWVEASEALGHAFAEGGGRRMVALGTCAEYADAVGGDDAPWPETRALAPSTPYGRAKAECAARLARIPGIELAWARIFHLFGPGEHPDRLVPSVILALLAGREARCASGRPVRDFASTRFVGAALAALVGSGVTGAVNVASGEGRAISEVVRFLGQAAGRPGLVRLGALPDRPGEVPRMVADVTRLRQEVGFAAAPDVEADLLALMETLRP
jgi:nucleoside-diphosphate-sugar epimerase